MSTIETVPNFIDGRFETPSAGERFPVHNPATGELIAETPLSAAAEVDRAVQAARAAWPAWRRIPPGERIQFLFKLKARLEERFEELARTITLENGKTLEESKGEMRRAIENVEVACGIPTLMQGDILEDIAPGIDEMMIRQPVGVCSVIVPFNFPGMIAFWYVPYALACGNTVVVKPSERVPLTMRKVFEIFAEVGFPKGVLNMVNGGKDTVNAILDHPGIAAVSFVGSSAVARHIYSRGAASGKRVQASGGAKNPVIVLADADMEGAVNVLADSAFGCAGQRCLAASLAVTIGDAKRPFLDAISAAAEKRVIGFGLDAGVQMGPVITPQSLARIEGLIAKGVAEGARAVVDGRGAKVKGYEKGNFVRPTVLADVKPGTEVARTEIFGPVLSVMHLDSIEEAIAYVNSGEYGNMACVFTTSGPSARRFRYECEVGNVGINVGIAAPMAYFPFSGWRGSFFGDLHGQGKHAVEFFTQTKVVVERWPKEWSRKF
jgi:malonate-semialdehyde dehydrogenase (acetylating)/methylmalonate-semialdehyde dehydrogenase